MRLTLVIITALALASLLAACGSGSEDYGCGSSEDYGSDAYYDCINRRMRQQQAEEFGRFDRGDVVATYCAFGAKSKAQYRGFRDHVPFAYVKAHRRTSRAARYALDWLGEPLDEPRPSRDVDSIALPAWRHKRFEHLPERASQVGGYDFSR
ncbi:MAG TPA: hypothetical protein VKB17_01875 [Thermoleophilaceae bacterium]|nr:hypothetical protein [Thermoleophilaceae bacterium]